MLRRKNMKPFDLKNMELGESILIHKAPDLSKIKSKDHVLVKFKTGRVCKMTYICNLDKKYFIFKIT